MQEHLEEGFVFLFDPETLVCYIECKDGPLTSIPSKVRDGALEVRGVSDAFFSTCVSLGIPLPSFITEIIGSWTQSLASLSEIEIPAHILVIGRSFDRPCFSCCLLRRVIFAPGSVLSVIDGFEECHSLTHIDIPASVVAIYTHGFRHCMGLVTVTFAPRCSLSVIRGFVECDGLRRIEIPGSVTEITGFRNCKSLTDVIFGSGSRLRNVGGFQNCSSLERVYMPDLTTLPIFDGLLPNVWIHAQSGNWSFIFQHGERHLFVHNGPPDFQIIPREVTVRGAQWKVLGISDSLFVAYETRAVSIPDFITSINSYFTVRNDSVTKIKIPASIEVLDGFADFVALHKVRFARGGHLRVVKGFRCCPLLKIIEIPASVEIIYNTAFVDCTSLSNVTFEDLSHLKVIDGFRECPQLCRIEIPWLVTQIAGMTSCTSLQTILFDGQEHLRVIDGFSKCIFLRTVTLPPSVEILGLTAFSSCSALKTVAFAKNGSLSKIDGFSDCKTLARLEIPSSVREISEHGFSNCSALETVRFAPDACLELLNGFHHCSALTSIAIPASVTRIALKGFSGCKSLREVTFLRGSRLVEVEGFSDCTSLQKIVFPASVRRVVGFNDCTALHEVTFPAGSELEVLKAFSRSSLSLIRLHFCPLRFQLPQFTFVEYYNDAILKSSRRLVHMPESAALPPRELSSPESFLSHPGNVCDFDDWMDDSGDHSFW
jgi:hypothetical protein